MSKYLKSVTDLFESNTLTIFIAIAVAVMLLAGGWFYWRREGLANKEEDLEAEMAELQEDDEDEDDDE
jgi:hypothetical protein